MYRHLDVAQRLAQVAHLEQAVATYSAAFAVQHAEQLPLLEHRLLVICPGDDLWTPSLRAKSLIRNGELVERWHWSHGFLDVHTAECASLLRAFFDSQADDRGGATVPLALPAWATAQAQAATAESRGGSTARATHRGFHAGPYGPLHYRLASGPPSADPQSRPRRPIVLLHMSPNSSRVFDALIPALAATRPVLAIDTPGFGESEAPSQPIGIEEFAAASLQVIDALGFAEVDVLGYHTGAMTAIELALRAPERIRHVVQISSPVYTPSEQEAARRQYRARELHPEGLHLVNAWKNLQQYYTPDVPRSVLGRNFTASLRGGPMSHWGHQAAFSYPLAQKLPQVVQPVLIINPEDDLVDETRRAPPLLKNGRLHELPGRAHGFMDQMTEEFSRLLEDFLDEP
jgi:pimeloyl-ACP methyl ester carboxylesterase